MQNHNEKVDKKNNNKQITKTTENNAYKSEIYD